MTLYVQIFAGLLNPQLKMWKIMEQKKEVISEKEIGAGLSHGDYNV